MPRTCEYEYSESECDCKKCKKREKETYVVCNTCEKHKKRDRCETCVRRKKECEKKPICDEPAEKCCKSQQHIIITINQV